MKNAQAKTPNPQKSGLEIINGPKPLKDIVTYKTMGPGSIHPVENAERHVELLEDNFQKWLEDDKIELLAAWKALKEKPSDSEAFLRLHRVIHTIYGNAATLNREIAGELALPLSRLFERRPHIENHIALIDSAIGAISASISNKKPATDEKLQEILDGLNQIVGRWISKQR